MSRATHDRERLPVLNDPSSFLSEQFASLRAQLNELRAEHPLKLIAVSSPYPGDGKSFVSANLALMFARESDSRVALVDCDLRNPTAHSNFGIARSPGLIGCLDKGGRASALTRCEGDLHVMPAGGLSDDPSGLLSSPPMKPLMDSLKAAFDTVVLDCPPLLPFSDALIVSRLADTLVMVLRQGKTPYDCIEKAMKLIDRSRLLGVVFNDVKPMLFHTHYRRAYYSAYGYDSKGRRKDGRLGGKKGTPVKGLLSILNSKD